MRLLAAIRAAGESADGAVMIVGNGFHEVRDQTDARMIAVFEGYDAKPTAEGVSSATTRTVVEASLAILALDFILTVFMFRGIGA